jgi:hypothetical protein
LHPAPSDQYNTPSTRSDGNKTTQSIQNTEIQKDVQSPSHQEREPFQEHATIGKLSRPISGLWDEAYTDLTSKDASLMQGYLKCLLAQSSGSALMFTANASATGLFGMSKAELHKQMLQIIKLKTEGNEAKQWKLNFLGHELAVKNLVSGVVGIIEWAKEYVASALKPSAVGSAAWAGVCLLLPVRIKLQT